MSAPSDNDGASPEDRDRNRELRRRAFATMAEMAENDPSVDGFTLLLPDGSTEFVPASALRRGGRA